MLDTLQMKDLKKTIFKNIRMISRFYNYFNINWQLINSNPKSSKIGHVIKIAWNKKNDKINKNDAVDQKLRNLT